ncbi:MAG: Mur ligase family protein, partial [Verrucomicrobiales bacterium]
MPRLSFTPRSGERIPGWWLRLRAVRTRLCRLLTRRKVITALITGSNGKTTTTNMLARILREAGHVVGKANTEGIYIDGQQVWQGDSSGFKGAGWVMTDPRVTAAALDTARGGLLTRGLYLSEVDVAVLTNIGLEHLGDRGIHSQEDMTAHKKRVTDAARKAVVLNADDPHCRRITQEYPLEKTILYTCEADNDFVSDHCSRGGRALCVDGSGESERIVFRDGGQSLEVIRVSAMPSARGGSLRFNVSNGLAAAGLAVGMGLSLEAVSKGLSRFQLDACDNPGRFTLLDEYGPAVLINYASNPLGLRSTVPAITAIPVSGRRFCL